MKTGGTLAEAKKGTSEIVVLAFLDDEPRHGYELARLIAARSNGALTFNFASLYATLYKLEDAGLIRGRWLERAGQRRRRYYRITAAGRTVLAQQRDDWRRFFDVVRDLAGLSHA